MKPTEYNQFLPESVVCKGALLLSMFIGLLTVSSLVYQTYHSYLALEKAASEIDILNQEQSNAQNLVQTEIPRQIVPMEQVADLNLFGQFVEVVEVAPVIKFEELPETQLNLILRAAFTDSETHKSSAVIEADDQPQSEESDHRYYINEMLPGDAVLFAINIDSVVLKRGDEYETLHFPGSTQPLKLNRPQRPTLATIPRPTSRQLSNVEPEETAVTMSPTAELSFSPRVSMNLQERLANLRGQ